MNKRIDTVLDYFIQISAVPRCSGNEQKIAEWLIEWAKKHNLEFKNDIAGNILIICPASEGYEKSPSLCLQGHMDMVCEKNPENSHDFSSDAISVVRDGDWLRAEGTTLGADNGIAIAMALAVVTLDIPHPSLELLFTVDEETGLTGASKIEPGFFSSKRLINLDSEDEGSITIGCAGGTSTRISLPLQKEDTPQNSAFYKITVSGLRGGHSGVNIAENRACANKILARLLFTLKEETSFNLIDLKGGNAHNAISRYAQAALSFFPEDITLVKSKIAEFIRELKYEYRDSENELNIDLQETTPSPFVFCDESTQKIINLILALPHGIAALTPDIDGLVETSNNLAVMNICNDNLEILISIRSSVQSRIKALNQRIAALTELAAAQVTYGKNYPAWQANTSSPLLNTAQQIFCEVYQKKPEILIIHAGLECAVLGQRVPDLDMISFGPIIENAHSPRERLSVPSLERTWNFLTHLLAGLR